MSVIAEKCPSCGAPLSVVGGRCSYCQTPLEVVRPDGTEAVPPDDVEQAPEDPNAPFSMAVEDIFSIKGRGTVITGRIATGTVRVGDQLVLDGPKGQRRAECKGVEMFRKVLDSATAGDNVGLLLKGLDRDDIEWGDQVHHA